MTDTFDRIRIAQQRNGAAVSQGAAMSQLDQVASVPRSPACPRCTMPMLLSRLEPHPREHATIDCVTYQCLCGELLTRPQTRR